MPYLYPIFTKRNILTALFLLTLIADIIGFGEYRRHVFLREISAIKQNLQVEKIDKEGLQNRIGNLEAELKTIKGENEAVLSKSVTALNEIGQISGTVSTLNKLSQIDQELLQKYSKTYFLNEHYVPTELTGINPEFTYVKNKILKIHAGVSPYLERLLDDAKAAALHLGVVSAYRPFGEQAVLKASYKFTYGAGTANQFSAEQGYSEHQLGTTVDLATPETADRLSGFDKTPEYAWLMNNAQKYGFILSYPQTNPYYKYEPWHWRFVGVALAQELYGEGRYFYEYDQRKINAYLANIFD